MPPAPFSPLWAVHIADGVLAWPWLLGGFALAGLLALLSAWRLKEEDIPQMAMITAVFFVASLIHVRVGPTSVHLLLNGLVGAVLGWRVGLVILVGLGLQAALIGHGGFTTLGVNSCVLGLPALLAGVVFQALRPIPWTRWPWLRASVVGLCAGLWLAAQVYGLALLFTTSFQELDPAPATAILLHPATLGGILLCTGGLIWMEHRLQHPPEFPLGLLIGTLTVLVTLLLNSLVLTWGGEENWRQLALLVFLAHVPVAAVEGVVLGFVVSFLARTRLHHDPEATG